MSFDDPPPDPPPGAEIPPADPHFRHRGGSMTTPTGQPKTGEPARRVRRERAFVMTFLWACVVLVVVLTLLALF